MLALLVTAGALLVSVRAFAQDEAPTLALLPAVVHSSESPNYLRRGLQDMLASRFDQGGVFKVIRVEDPRKATTRLEDALEVARDVEADFVLFGSFTRFGAGASLDMQAAATAEGIEGETLREIFVHSGSMGEVIPDLVDLVGKVTRFAVTDYVPPASSEEDAAGGSARTQPARIANTVEDLQNRVAELEAAIAGLQAAAPASP
jgi:TolB-like protein